jgi:excisionase family DNA binding protein
MSDDIPQDLVTPREAARQLKVHLATIYRWILSGALPAWRRGQNRYMVSRAAVAAMLQPVRPHGPGPATRAQVNARNRHTEEVLRRHGLA